MAEAKKKLPPSFEIYSASPNYNGVHPSRVRFEGGVGRTADVKQAEHCRGCGLAVFDVNDDDDAAELKKFKRRRAGEADETPAEPTKK